VGIRISIGGKVSALDNAGVLRLAQAGTPQPPLAADPATAQSALFEWIECCYGPRRLYSTLGYLSSNNSNNRNRKSRKKQEAA
jgi:hypothetical protein